MAELRIAFPATEALLQCFSELVLQQAEFESDGTGYYPAPQRKLMLPLKHLTEQDKRALWLYLALALLSAICMAGVMFSTSNVRFGPKAEKEQLTSPLPTLTPSKRK